MRKDRESLISKLGERLAKLYNSIKNLDWNDPNVILAAICCVIFPFTAWYYVSTGLVIGLLMTISILWGLEKSPVFLKELMFEHPLLTDMILSALAVMTIGGYFGTGLALGLGAIFTGVLLSWAIPVMARRFTEQQKKNETDPIPES